MMINCLLDTLLLIRLNCLNCSVNCLTLLVLDWFLLPNTSVSSVFKYLAEKYLQQLKQQTAEETEVAHTTSNKIGNEYLFVRTFMADFVLEDNRL